MAELRELKHSLMLRPRSDDAYKRLLQKHARSSLVLHRLRQKARPGPDLMPVIIVAASHGLKHRSLFDSDILAHVVFAQTLDILTKIQRRWTGNNNPPEWKRRWVRIVEQSNTRPVTDTRHKVLYYPRQ